MIKISVGNVMSAIDQFDPKTKQAVEGFSGGEVSDQNASILFRASNGWRNLCVHPIAAEIVAWSGRSVPLSMSDI